MLEFLVIFFNGENLLGDMRVFASNSDEARAIAALSAPPGTDGIFVEQLN